MTEQPVDIAIPPFRATVAPTGDVRVALTRGFLLLSESDLRLLNATVTPVVPPEPRLPVWVDNDGVEWFHCGHHRQWERVDGVHIGGALRWPDLVARGGHLEGEDLAAAEIARLRRGLENLARETGDEPAAEAYARAVLDGCKT